MSVVIETTLGDITVDLFLDQRPITCLNFLKLCKMKYYNFNLFHSIRSGFIAQTGDPSGEGSGGQSIWGLLNGPEKRFFSGEKMPKIRHTDAGLLSMVCTGEMMVGSQFFFTLGPDLDSLDGVHCVIGEVTEGHEILRKLNDVICDETHRPYQDVRITHTVVLEDPFSDPPGLRAPSRSPSPSAERLKGGRIAPDEELDEGQGKTAAELQEMIEEKEAKARATILEIVGDLPDADIAPPENVLFVCKLNPVTTDEDLEIIFSRFGKIVSCEVIRDKKSGESLQYAFIEFDDKKSCEDAYFKMDNVLIDDRRIHVDFSQSVSKMRWLGKGRGVQHFNDDGSKVSDNKQGRSWRDDRRQHSRKDEDDNRRHGDVSGKRVTNERSYRERSRSKSKTNYRHRDHHDSERQNSRKTDEYTKEQRDKRRDRSSSKTKSSFDKTEKSNDKKDRSRNRYEDKYEQTDVRNQNPSYYRNERSESSKDDKYRSSRQSDEARKQDRQSHKNEIKARNNDQERNRNLVEKDEYISSKNYSEKLVKQSHKDRNKRDDISDGGRGNDENPRSRNQQQYKSDSVVVEKGHKSNSDDYHKDKQNSRVENEHKSRNEKERHNYENPSRNKPDEHSDYAAKDSRYKNKDGTNKNEIISHKSTEKDFNKCDSYDSKHDKHNKSRKERNYENELEDNKNNQQLHEPGNIKDTKSKKKHPDTENFKKDLQERQERKERDGSDRHKSGNKNSHQTKKKKRPTESSLDTEIAKQDHSKDKEKHQKGKAKEEIKRKDAKKKISDKKKASNKKENSKRKRKSSTSSDSDSDSSDSSSSSSSSSSSDSDHKRKKKRRKYSTSSSSSDSSSSSSSDSSTSSTSSSDSDAKKKKIKKRRTKITKAKKK